MRRYLAKPSRMDRRFWRCTTVLDQGPVGACVGYAWKYKLLAAPFMVGTGPEACQIYAEAQTRDDLPDTPPGDGTTVRAGAKYLQELGYIGEYVWAFSVDDVAQWLLLRGPVVLGLNWYAAMDEPDSHGLLHLYAQDDLRGGHAILALGVDVPARRVRLLNSWGTAWGDKGRCWIGFDDLDNLLALDGEACAATELRIPLVVQTSEESG